MVPKIVILGAVADVAAVLVFVAAGLRAHAEAGAVLALLSTAGPFLAGLVAAWLFARAWLAPLAVRTGVVVWSVTVIVGLAVRGAFTERLPLSFALVTTLVLGVLLVGWRAVAVLVRTRPGGRGAGDT